MENLKEKTLRGAAARLCAQVLNFGLRLATLAILARVLRPEEFGLVGMVAAFTGVLGLFRDFGLSSAVVQSATITDRQTSGLFWINALVGAVLGVLAAAMAPAVAGFYHEPRLFWVTVVSAAAFPINALGVQHTALLKREMRFTALAVINIVALLAGNTIGVVGALAGYGYWALVAMTITFPLVTTIGTWLTGAWVPGKPQLGIGLRPLARFGGTITLTGLVSYIATNCEKVLLGRFWGADALGVYGRAYQLMNIPTENLNSAAGEVAFSALSRLRDDPARLRTYFLKGYGLILALTVPITVGGALFADDTIAVVLGPQWNNAVVIFRLLTPTILVFAVVNPMSWLMDALGLVERNLKVTLVVAPIMIGGFLVGLRYGPPGVALAYSTVMLLVAFPIIAYCVRGTAVSFRAILQTMTWPLSASIVAGGIAFAVRLGVGPLLAPVARLALETLVLVVAYLGFLLFVGGQRYFYLELLRGFYQRASVDELVSARVG